jgi:hypothetical protein
LQEQKLIDALVNHVTPKLDNREMHVGLKPETIARMQGILDGTIKVEPAPPADLSKLSAGTRARIQELLNKPMAVTAVAPLPTIEEPDMEIQEPDAASLRNADQLIAMLDERGYGDYTGFRTQIALDIYDNGHYSGHDTAHFDPQEHDETSTLQGFYVIQEDHYDQHMDEDPDRPEWTDMVCDVPNGYLWMN